MKKLLFVVLVCFAVIGVAEVASGVMSIVAVPMLGSALQDAEKEWDAERTIDLEKRHQRELEKKKPVRQSKSINI